MLGRTDLVLDLGKSLRNWQLATFLLSITNAVLIIALTRLALAGRVVPYLVEVAPDGQTTYAGPIEALDTPEERLVVHQLRSFLWNLRAVTSDPVAQAELLARAYALADAPLRRRLDAHFARLGNDPRRLAQTASRAATAITILRLPSSDEVYQVRWTEATSPRSAGSRIETRTYEGLLTVARIDRLPPEAVARNPLGLLVTDFNWTETTPVP